MVAAVKCPNCQQAEVIRVELVDIETKYLHQLSDWCPDCDCLQAVADDD